jgi:hypothetical protein
MQERICRSDGSSYESTDSAADKAQSDMTFHRAVRGITGPDCSAGTEAD